METMTNPKKTLLLSITSVCLIVLVYYQFNKQQHQIGRPQLASEDHIVNSVAGAVVSEHESKSKPVNFNVNQSTPAQLEDKWRGDEAQKEEIKVFFESHGWFDPSDEHMDDYKSYSEDSLIELSNHGDLRALEILAFRSRDPEKVKSYFNKAAIYGSTHAYFGLINHILSFNELTDKSSTDEKKALFIQLYAYKAIANIRGDYSSVKDAELKSTLTKLNYELTENDRSAIDSEAQKMYSQMENERKNLGLPPFDNTISPAARAYYKAFGTLQ